MFLSDHLGKWVFVFLARSLSTVFFVVRPGKTAMSVDFYKTLFPGKSRWFYLRCALKQYHNFTDVFLDRYLLTQKKNLSHTSRGWEHIERALDENTGGIILMSHMGSWEVAARIMKQLRPDLRLLLYMGTKDKEEIEGIQKETATQDGINIIANKREGEDPFDILPAIHFLKEGGFVSLTGDRVWSSRQQTVRVDFLGNRIDLPKIPYILALLTKAPLFIFFSFRKGPEAWHFSISEPVYLTVSGRKEREETIRQAAQTYADILEEKVRQHPFEWYHFEPFLKGRP
jgi:lauroyl/myristoyl acyltransferase